MVSCFTSIRLLILIGYQPNDKERCSIQRYKLLINIQIKSEKVVCIITAYYIASQSHVATLTAFRISGLTSYCKRNVCIPLAKH